MKLRDEIINNQIEVLRSMGVGIKDWRIVYTSNYGITYHIDIETKENNTIQDIHFAIFYNWEKNELSIQVFYPNKFMKKSLECLSLTDFHSIIINTIVSYIYN